ncbi:cytochrome P450 67 [Paraphoma chrysanthemicola]|uniref:Cytochrome P450 67 n=1 Tax=Paraphoma chrysanthemicola TaxID=798071 RepID=A0A8K0RB59_9PLEO|nr:cytochrome P450 67 [Paraphoma chrysanthemicola]
MAHIPPLLSVPTAILPLAVLARASNAHVLQASILAGILFHFQVARPEVEFERSMVQFIRLCSLLSGVDFLASVLLVHRSVLVAAFRLCTAWGGFTIGLTTSLVIYRFFLHRCRRFPGPVLAKLTRFHAAYLNAQEEQFYEKLGDMHQKYGDFVRVGPREISILDPAAIPVLYGPGTECRKATFYTISGSHDDITNLNGIRDPAKYRPRRRAWDRGMSMKALSSYQPRIKAQADELIQQLRIRQSQPVDVSKWSMFFSFDTMGEVGFGRDFGNMKSGEEHPGIQQMHGHLWMLGVIQAVPWLATLLSGIPEADRGIQGFHKVCNGVLAEKQKLYKPDQEPEDVVSWFLKAVHEKDPSASPTALSLADDNRAFIVAGSDTTANTLANALFYLAKNEQVQHKLRSQLDEVASRNDNEWTYSKVKEVFYIDDIINETLRLKPPVMQGMPRETPSQGVHIAGNYVPGHVIASVPIILIQRDPRYWKQANDFIPERFGERRKEMGTDDSPWIPFQIGMHGCAGRNLAYMTLRIALSAIVQNFDITFAPGETGTKFDGDFLASFMMVLRPLNLVFTPRSEA